MNFGIITAIFRPFLLNYCWVCILLFSFTFTGIQTEQNYYYEILLPHIVKFLIEHSTFLFKDSSLFSLTLQGYTIKTAFPPFYCIISPHPRKLGTNRAVETSRSRYRECRRHRCRRYGVREDLLLIQVVFTQKGADEAKRNRRWCRWLLPTKKKPLFYFGWAQDKGFKTLNNLFDWYTTKVALSFITTSIKLFRI